MAGSSGLAVLNAGGEVASRLCVTASTLPGLHRGDHTQATMRKTRRKRLQTLGLRCCDSLSVSPNVGILVFKCVMLRMAAHLGAHLRTVQLSGNSAEYMKSTLSEDPVACLVTDVCGLDMLVQSPVTDIKTKTCNSSLVLAVE